MANSTASSWLCRLHIATITVTLRTGTATARPAAPNTAHPKITRSGSNIKAIPAISASLQPQTLISEDLLHSTSTANANPKPKSGTVLRVDLNLGRYGTGVDRLGFEPRTSCLQSRRSSADLPARRAHSVAAQMKLSAWLSGPMASAILPERTSLKGHLYSSWHMDLRLRRHTGIYDGVRRCPGWRGAVGASRLGSTLMSVPDDDGT